MTAAATNKSYRVGAPPGSRATEQPASRSDRTLVPVALGAMARALTRTGVARRRVVGNALVFHQDLAAGTRRPMASGGRRVAHLVAGAAPGAAEREEHRGSKKGRDGDATKQGRGSMRSGHACVLRKVRAFLSARRGTENEQVVWQRRADPGAFCSNLTTRLA